MAQLIVENKSLYLKWLGMNDMEDRRKYNRSKYIIKKETKKRKNEAWIRKCAHDNSMIGGSGTKYV